MRDLASSFLIASLAASMAAQAPQPKMGEPLHGLTTAQLQAFADGRVEKRYLGVAARAPSSSEGVLVQWLC